MFCTNICIIVPLAGADIISDTKCYASCKIHDMSLHKNECVSLKYRLSSRDNHFVFSFKNQKSFLAVSVLVKHCVSDWQPQSLGGRVIVVFSCRWSLHLSQRYLWLYIQHKSSLRVAAGLVSEYLSDFWIYKYPLVKSFQY